MNTMWDSSDDPAGDDTFDALLTEVWRPFCTNNITLDLDETSSGYVVRASVPGIPPESLQITLHNNVLTICGEVPRQSTRRHDENRRVIIQERRVGKFSRSIRLREAVNAREAVMQVEHGVVTLLLPKGPHIQKTPVTIDVV